MLPKTSGNGMGQLDVRTVMTAVSVPRTHRGGRRGLLVSASATVLLLAGCGSPKEEAAEEAFNFQNGPMAKLMGYDISPAEQRERELNVQQGVVECMKDEGWEYEAVDYSASNPYQDEYEEQVADPVAYGEKYGYGVARNYELQGVDGGGFSFEDPNQQYVESLVQEEMDEYYISLYGDQSGMEMQEGDVYVPPPVDERGCEGKARFDVFGESPYDDPDISTRLNELYEDQASDPGVADAIEVWAECMDKLDSSNEFDTPDKINEYLYNQLNELQGYGTTSDATTATVVEGVAVTEPIAIDGEPQEIDEADLEDLRAEELALWADDQVCQDEANLSQARRDAEQRMVDDLVAEFPELGEQE